MRTIPSDLQAEFASGAMTLCRCWKAIRRDGATFGFTDHDRDLAFGGVTFRAHTGLEASETESLLGLAVGSGEVSGALHSEALSDADIDAGLWDQATVETWLVDWRDNARRMLLDAGQIGEIRRSGQAFTAELRSLAHLLDREVGRRYTALCGAELGDRHCRVDLDSPERRLLASVAAVPDPARITIDAPPGFSSGTFAGGVIRFVDGAMAGVSAAVMDHARVGAQDVISLWTPLKRAVAVGDVIALTVGCDKTFSTCRDHFGNAANFRGFPHIPGNEIVISYARTGDAGLDGGSLTP